MFKAHRLLCHSTLFFRLESNKEEKKKKVRPALPSPAGSPSGLRVLGSGFRV